MKIINIHICTKKIEKDRIGHYLSGLFFELPTNAGIKKALKKGRIILNGKKASSATWVNAGDIIELTESGFIPPKEFKLTLEVVYEDEFMVVINKPAEFLSVPGIDIKDSVYTRIKQQVKNISRSTTADVLCGLGNRSQSTENSQ